MGANHSTTRQPQSLRFSPTNHDTRHEHSKQRTLGTTLCGACNASTVSLPATSKLLKSSDASTIVHSNEKLPLYLSEDSHSVAKPAAIQPVYRSQILANTMGDVCLRDYHSFLQSFPEFRLTWILENLRRSDFSRLERNGETYVDYMGGAVYPESLVRVHTDFLSENILGNTHSVSNSSKLSVKCATEARETVLQFLDAPADNSYTCIFTHNASGALKLVGESYPFSSEGSYVLAIDSHNSVHGIREFASRKGTRVEYIPSTENGGMELPEARDILLCNQPRVRSLGSGSRSAQPPPSALFALTAQSNITNSKFPLSVLDYAKSLGYDTLVDLAAFAPTSKFSLNDFGGSVDAVALSFYKMFGYPTGIGALVVKTDFLKRLKRPWFAGGTVNVVQVPGNIVTLSHEAAEQFEDGTINYLGLSAVTDGLRFLSAYLPFLPLRLNCLLHHLYNGLSSLRHDTDPTMPVVRILSRKPKKRLKSVGKQSDVGSLISCLFLFASGEMIPNAFIEYAASKHNISLRTGCMCNPGGAMSILSLEKEMKHLYPGATRQDLEREVGRELGVVRISLGLASNFQDIWNVIRFGMVIGTERTRKILWDDWIKSSDSADCCIGIGTAL